MELQEKKKNRTEQKTDMQNKEKALLTQLDEIAKQDLCLAFSGGVDSSLLLKLVMDASAKYGTKVYAVTFQTRLHPPCDLETATRVAKEVGAVHEVLFVDELEQEAIRYNPENRCYLCKHYLFGKLLEFARDHGVTRYSTEQMRMTFMSTGGAKSAERIWCHQPACSVSCDKNRGKSTCCKVRRFRSTPSIHSMYGDTPSLRGRN